MDRSIQSVRWCFTGTFREGRQTYAGELKMVFIKVLGKNNGQRVTRLVIRILSLKKIYFIRWSAASRSPLDFVRIFFIRWSAACRSPLDFVRIFFIYLFIYLFIYFRPKFVQSISQKCIKLSSWNFPWRCIKVMAWSKLHFIMIIHAWRHADAILWKNWIPNNFLTKTHF